MANVSATGQIINFGEASKFALLSGNSIHGASKLYCNGKIGARNDIDSVMRSNDSILSNNNGSVPLALTDLQTQITTLNNLTGNAISGNLNGQTLSAGVFKINGNCTLNGTLNLIGDTSSVFIFLVSDSLKIDSLANINKGTVYGYKVIFVAENIVLNNLFNILGNYISKHNIYANSNFKSNSSLLCLNSIYTSGYFFNDVNFESVALQQKAIINATCNLQFDCNLVKNGDLSYYSAIPQYYNLINFACDWGQPVTSGTGQGSTDYFSSLSTTQTSPVNIPNTILGYSFDHTYGSTIMTSGKVGAMAGIILYSDVIVNTREYLKAKLFTPLVASVKYYFEMYNKTPSLVSWNVDGLGVLITDVNITSPNFQVLPYLPTFSNPTNSLLSSNWSRFSGCYTASGNEQYIVIGNFKTDANTNVVPFNLTTATDHFAYSFIDDVSLVKLADAGPPAIMCKSSGVIIGPCYPIANPAYTYSWAPATGLSSTSVANPIASPVINTIYTVTVNNNSIAGCSATSTVLVTVNNTTSLNISTVVTQTCSNSSASLTVTGGTPPYSFLWSNGQKANPAIGLTSGVYTVTVTSNGGCTGSATISVVNTLPTAAPDIQGSHAMCVAGTYSLTNSYTGTPVTYAWSYQLLPSTTLIPNGTGTIANFSPVLFNSAQSDVNIYCVVTNTVTGCSASSSITLYRCCSGTFNFSSQTSNGPNGVMSNPAFSGNIVNGSFTTYANQTVFINGTFTVNSNFTFNHANVVLGPDARIIVQGNNQLHIVDGSHLYSCNGDYMWDGIYVGSANAVNQGFIEVIGSTIEDGLNAIVSSNGGRLKLWGSTFNKNFKHVVINNYAGSSTFCDIKSSSLTCNTSAGAPAVLIKPYLNFKSKVGIEINNASLIRIEDIVGTNFTGILPTTTLFQNLDYGIKATNSSFEVYLCRFQNINTTNAFAPAKTCGTAIYAEGKAKPNTTYYYATIGTQVTPTITINMTYTYPNEFVDCNSGINLNNNMASTIAFNMFNNIKGTGISLNNASGIDYTVHDNTLSNFNIGISGSNLYSMPLLNVSKNTLLGLKTPQITNYGILFNNATLNSNNLVLFNNSITNCRIGTYATNIDGLLMNGNVTEKNAITYDDAPAANRDYYGVWLQYCPNARINYAEVTYNKAVYGPLPLLNYIKIQGVTIENSNGAIISQCKMVDLSSGIRIKNDNLGSELHCNKMDNCLRGVNLENANFGPNPTQGVIGTGNAGTPWDNQWLNMTPTNIRVNGTVGLNYKINWLCQGNASTQSYYPGNGYNTQTSVSVINPMVTQTGINACLPLLPAHENEYQDEVIDDVADATTGGGQTYEEQYYDDEYAYRKLNEDSTLLNPADSAYQLRLQFYTAQSQTAIGKFYRIKSWIDAGAMDTAIAGLATITASNTVEQNIYTTFYIYLTTYATGVLPDSMQLATLENIATQHVMSGGPGVYNARAMLNWEQDDIGGALRLQSTSEIVSEVKINEHPNFYPNPTSTTIYLPYSINQFETVSVEVYNFMGSKLRSQNFSQDQIIAIDLTTESNGFYFAKVYLNNKIWFCNKIIVAKK